MAETKAFYQSRGVTGSLTAIALSAFMLISAGVKQYTDKTVPPMTYDTLTEIQDIAEQETDHTTELMASLMATLAGFRALAGRLNAKTDIALRKPKLKPDV